MPTNQVMRIPPTSDRQDRRNRFGRRVRRLRLRSGSPILSDKAAMKKASAAWRRACLEGAWSAAKFWGMFRTSLSAQRLLDRAREVDLLRALEPLTRQVHTKRLEQACFPRRSQPQRTAV